MWDFNFLMMGMVLFLVSLVSYRVGGQTYVRAAGAVATSAGAIISLTVLMAPLTLSAA